MHHKRLLSAFHWVELIFLTVTGMGCVLHLCWDKAVLITQGWFSCVSTAQQQSRPFLLSTPPVRKRLGVLKHLEGNTARTADPNGPRGHPRPYGAMLSRQSWGEKKGETFGVRALVFPSHHCMRWSPAIVRMLKGTELIPCLAFLKCMAFALVFKTTFISKHEVFSHSLFWFLPHPTAGEQVVWCLAAAGLSHESVTPLWDNCLTWQCWPGTLSLATEQKLFDTGALLWWLRQQQQLTAAASWLSALTTDEHCVYWKSAKFPLTGFPWNLFSLHWGRSHVHTSVICPLKYHEGNTTQVDIAEFVFFRKIKTLKVCLRKTVKCAVAWEVQTLLDYIK